MCGLVGIAGDFGYKHRGVMKTLLFFNTLRGADSTGVTVYNQDTNIVDTRKLTVPGYEFIELVNMDALLSLNPGVWMGHGRFKTVGLVNKANAHPFEVYDDKDCVKMFGAHNGTLSNKWDLEKLLKERRFGTDSEALLNLIAEVGPKDAIAQARGAWALTWWDSATDTINLLRNKERPLCYAITKDEKVVIWASEPWMIRISCLREGVELRQTDKGEDEVWALPEDTLFSWTIPEFKGIDDILPSPVRKGGLLGKPEEKKFPLSPWYGGSNHYGDDDWAKDIADKEAEKIAQTNAKGRANGKDHYVGFKGKEVSREEVEEYKRSGCDWCSDVVHDNDFAWLDEMSICCRKCLRGEHVYVNTQTGEIIDIHMLITENKKGNRW